MGVRGNCNGSEYRARRKFVQCLALPSDFLWTPIGKLLHVKSWERSAFWTNCREKFSMKNFAFGARLGSRPRYHPGCTREIVKHNTDFWQPQISFTSGAPIARTNAWRTKSALKANDE